MVLSDKFIVDIAVGAEYTLCVTKDNEVYAWGGNGEGKDIGVLWRLKNHEI